MSRLITFRVFRLFRLSASEPSNCFHCDPRVPSVPSPFSQGRFVGELSSYPCSHATNFAHSTVYLYDNSSGRSAIYRLPARKLLAVDRIFIYGFVSLISVVTGNGNPMHFKSIIHVGKPTASYILPTYFPTQTLFCSRVLLTSSVVPALRL